MNQAAVQTEQGHSLAYHEPKHHTIARTESQQAQGGTIISMLNTAVERGADFNTIERLMDMHERFERNEARKAFALALQRFKAKGIVVTKDHHVQFNTTNYWHATLAHIAKTIDPALAEVGLCYRWRTEQTPQSVTVTCEITHELGHSETTTLSGPLDLTGGKNGIQAVGSSVSYLERYTLLAALGLSTEDDDGRQNQTLPNQQQTQQHAQQHTGNQTGFITQGQQRQLIAAAKAKGYTEADLCQKAHVEHVSQIPSSRYEAAKNHFKHCAPKQGGQQ